MRIRIPLLTLLLALPACDDGEHEDEDDHLPSCAEDDRDDTYVAGIAKSGSASYTVTLMDSTPAPPSKGDNSWTIEITEPGGEKAPGLGIDVVPFMPDHGHGTPAKATVGDSGNGAYTLDPVNLFMPGYWEISINLVDPGETSAADDDVDLDTVMFKFCVEG